MSPRYATVADGLYHEEVVVFDPDETVLSEQGSYKVRAAGLWAKRDSARTIIVLNATGQGHQNLDSDRFQTIRNELRELGLPDEQIRYIAENRRVDLESTERLIQFRVRGEDSAPASYAKAKSARQPQ
jgi:hypothetical protein